MRSLRRLLSVFYLYLAITGMFSFTAFIMEESLQMLTFSMFVVKDTQRWDIAYKNINIMTKINKNLDLITRYTLWLNPLQQIAYKDFVLATDGYLDAQTALVMANDPGLFTGQSVAISFYFKSITQTQSDVILKAGKLSVRVKSIPIENPIYIIGIIEKISNDHFVIVAKS
ncbi:MAG: hypothetical protein HQK65_02270 [Desulfamplus sp.]|nr:hypothetical protein [Desulfamplus sp.]